MKEATIKYDDNNGPDSRDPGRRGFCSGRGVAMEEAEEGMMGIGSPMSKVTQRIAFNVIIISARDI